MTHSKNADKIEVTPEMIEAGAGTYLKHCPDSGAEDFLDYRMVAEIYSAMRHEMARVGGALTLDLL